MIIKNGTIVTASDTYQADLLIKDGIITSIGLKFPEENMDTVIDAAGKYVFPGGIDVHTHFELPFMGTVSADNFTTGSTAAICGGTTSIIDFVIPEKGKPLNEALEKWKEKAQGKTAADYSFHMAITEYNDEIAREIPSIISKGITSFKCFMAYKNVFQVDDSQLISVMKNIGQNGGLLSVHAENGHMIDTLISQYINEGKTTPEYHFLSHPAAAEAEAVQRAIMLADFAGQPLYIVHLSSAEGLAKVKQAVAEGKKVFAETCPQYLLLASDLYSQAGFEGAKYVMSPPLRPKENFDELWDGIARGFIQVVATDHCPFNFSGQKDMGVDNFTKIPNGIPAVGDRFNLLYSYGVGENRLSLNRFVEVTATAPAKIFGMYPQKGSIVIGGDADLVIFDPEATGVISVKNQKHSVDYSAFEGFKLKGLPETVLLRGKVAVQNGKFIGQKDQGKFIPRLSSGKLA